MSVEHVPAVIKRRQPQILVEYQRDINFPWAVVGFYSNQIVADKVIKRLSKLIPGRPSFRTR